MEEKKNKKCKKTDTLTRETDKIQRVQHVRDMAECETKGTHINDPAERSGIWKIKPSFRMVLIY